MTDEDDLPDGGASGLESGKSSMIATKSRKTIMRSLENLIGWVSDMTGGGDGDEDPSSVDDTLPLVRDHSASTPINNLINKRTPVKSEPEPDLHRIRFALGENDSSLAIRGSKRAPGSRHGSIISDDIDSDQFHMQRSVCTEIELDKALRNLRKLKKELKNLGEAGKFDSLVDECQKSVRNIKKRVMTMTHEASSHGQVEQYRNLLHKLGHNEQFQEDERIAVQWISHTHMQARAMTPSSSLGSRRRSYYGLDSRRTSVLSRISGASGISGISDDPSNPVISSSANKEHSLEVISPSNIDIRITGAEASNSPEHFSDSLPEVITDGAREELLEKVLALERSHDIANCLVDFNEWNFDVFDLHRQAGDLTMPICGLQIFREMGISKKLNIGESVFIDFLNRVSQNYQPLDKVLYHNFIHGTDVMCTHYYFTKSDTFAIVSDLERFASICAAACHDVDHNGFTNDFHMRTESKLAITYNDKSILENHHASLGWRLVRQTKLLQSLTPAQRAEFRAIFIHCILGTDMSFHSAHLEELITIAEGRKDASAGRSAMETSERLLGLSVHTADLSNVAKPFELCKKSVKRVFDEFFRQGDKEAELQLPISMLCDRHKTNIEKSEALFIQFLVKPWFGHWASVIQEPARICMRNLESNYDRYVNISKLREPAPKLRITKRKSMFERGALLRFQQENLGSISDHDLDTDNLKTPEATDLVEFSNSLPSIPYEKAAHHGRVHSDDELSDEISEGDEKETSYPLTPNATPEERTAMLVDLPPVLKRPSLKDQHLEAKSTAKIPQHLLENEDSDGSDPEREEEVLPIPDGLDHLQTGKRNDVLS